MQIFISVTSKSLLRQCRQPLHLRKKKEIHLFNKERQCSLQLLYTGFEFRFLLEVFKEHLPRTLTGELFLRHAFDLLASFSKRIF